MPNPPQYLHATLEAPGHLTRTELLTKLRLSGLRVSHLQVKRNGRPAISTEQRDRIKLLVVTHTQSAVAEIVGVSAGTVSNVVRGKA